jgi:acetyltransferase-like isoleucine patch superfamily enzyme
MALAAPSAPAERTPAREALDSTLPLRNHTITDAMNAFSRTIERAMLPALRLLGRVVVKLASYDTGRLRLHVAGERIQGPADRVILGENVDLQNSFLNTVCGTIKIGDLSFCGQNCMFITGKHDYTKRGWERRAHPDSGNDIEIGVGVWIGSGAIILGGVRIADHAVIGAGAVVTSDCPCAGIYAGVPARLIKPIEFSKPRS